MDGSAWMAASPASGWGTSSPPWTGNPPTRPSLAHILATKAVGDRVAVDYFRAGTTGNAQLTLTEQP